jgi:hypothetical protein
VVKHLERTQRNDPKWICVTISGSFYVYGFRIHRDQGPDPSLHGDGHGHGSGHRSGSGTIQVVRVGNFEGPPKDIHFEKMIPEEFLKDGKY